MLARVHLAAVFQASLLTIVMIALLALRWRLFLRQQDVQLPFRTVLSLTWAGQFFNSVLPGSTGGDVVKIYQLCRLFPNRKAAAAVSVIIDRMSAFVALAALAAVAFLAGPTLGAVQPASLRQLNWWWFLALPLAAGAVAIAILKVLRSPHWLARIRHIAGVARTSFTLNWNMALAMALAFAIHFLNFFIAYVFARALGIQISYAHILLIMPIVLFLVLLPVTINGHGLREVVLIFYFTAMHITMQGNPAVGVAETVVSLSVLLVANDLLWAIPGGLWYLAFRRPALPAATSENTVTV